MPFFHTRTCTFIHNLLSHPCLIMFFRFVARLSRLIPWTNWKSASAQLLAPLLTFYLLKMPNDWSVPAVVVGYEFLCNGAYLCNSSFKLVLALPYISWFTLTSTVTSTYSVCPVSLLSVPGARTPAGVLPSTEEKARPVPRLRPTQRRTTECCCSGQQRE